MHIRLSNSTSLHRNQLPSAKFLTEDIALILGLLPGQDAVDPTIAHKATVDAVRPASVFSPAMEQLPVEAVVNIGGTLEGERCYDQGEGKLGPAKPSRRELHRDLVSVRLIEELVLGMPRLALEKDPPLLDSPANPLGGGLDPHPPALHPLVL